MIPFILWVISCEIIFLKAYKYCHEKYYITVIKWRFFPVRTFLNTLPCGVCESECMRVRVSAYYINTIFLTTPEMVGSWFMEAKTPNSLFSKRHVYLTPFIYFIHITYPKECSHATGNLASSHHPLMHTCQSYLSAKHNSSSLRYLFDFQLCFQCNTYLV